VTPEHIQHDAALNWPLSKVQVRDLVVHETEKIANKWSNAKPGEVLTEKQLVEDVILKISRSPYHDSVVFNLFRYGDKIDSAQVELRRSGDEIWDLADRQVADVFKGKGILSAFVAAAEKFVQIQAEGEKRDHRIVLETGQPNVFQVFEHLQYQLKADDFEQGRRLRNPAQFDKEVVVQNAWIDNRQNTNMTEMTNRDPYCFRKATLIGNPHPTPDQAVRVTLEKIINPRVATGQIKENIHTEAKELF